MTSSTEWHGTTDEWRALTQAVEAHCVSACHGLGNVAPVCPAHAMLLHDQRALDGLLFARRISTKLRKEEFQPELTADPAYEEFLARCNPGR